MRYDKSRAIGKAKFPLRNTKNFSHFAARMEHVESSPNTKICPAPRHRRNCDISDINFSSNANNVIVSLDKR